MRPVRIRLVAALLGAVAAVLSFLVTAPPGPGLDPDAMQYLGAAESLVHQGALRIPESSWDDADSTSTLQHFPPGYSLVLAPLVAAGIPAVQAGRLEQAVAAGGTLALAFLLVSAAGSSAAGLLAAAMLLVTPAMASDHVRILSEPLFLALLIATLILMVRLPERPLACGVLAAAAGLVRYAGFSLTGAAVLMALWRGGPERRGRLRAAALVAAPGVLAQAVWSLRTRLEGGSVRSITVNGDVGAALREGWHTLLYWLAPGVPSPARLIVAAAVAVLACGLLVRAARRDPVYLGGLGIAGGCFAALVFVSRLIADPGIPFDERMLSPLMVLASLAVAASVPLVFPRLSSAARTGTALLLAAWIVASGVVTRRFVHEARDGGWGYAMESWRSSRLVGWLRAEGPRFALFTNNAAGIFFFTHRPSRGLPDSYDPEEVADFGDALRSRRGVIVAFTDGYDAEVSPDSVARLLRLRTLVHTASGTVFRP